MKIKLGFCILITLVTLLVSCNNSANQTPIVLEERTFKHANPDTSLARLSAMLITSPKDPILFNERAKVYLRLGMHQNALADIKSSILLDTTKAEFFVTLADIYWATKELIPCEDALNKALRLNPKYPITYFRKGKLAFYAQKPDKAFELINEGLKLDVNNAEGYYWKAMTYVDLKNFDLAISNFMTAIERNPDYYDAYYQLGLLFIENKDVNGLLFLNNAIKIDSTRQDALYARGYHFQTIGDTLAAIADYYQILRHSDMPEAAFNIGYLMLQNNEIVTAKSFFEKASLADSTYADAWYNQGLCFEVLENKSDARRLYEKTLSINPKHDKAKNGLYRLR